MVDDIRVNRRPGESVPGESDEKPEEPAFTPPEAIAHEEEAIDMTDSQNKKPEAPKLKAVDKITSTCKAQYAKLRNWWNKRSKKEKIIIPAASVIVIILLILGGFWLLQRSKPAPKAPTVIAKKEEVKEPPKPTTEPSRLTGVQVPPEYNLLPVTGIMIENSPDARPQSGLKEAGVVFEAIAEGGITRFLTLYQEDQPGYVGPVRSVRPYYLQWLQGFDAAVAHVGGSPDALAKIRNEGIKDLDQSFNGGSYQRISQRYAPHNVYTSLGSLLALQKSKGFGSSNFTGFARKADKPLPAPNVRKIDFAISGPLYNVHYDYDAPSNSYRRSQGGMGHADERTGQSLNPRVVIALVMPQGIERNGIHTTYNTLGSGTAYFFQDGTITQGLWSKSSDKEQFRFVDANGSPIALNAGQTWITILGAAANVTHAP